MLGRIQLMLTLVLTLIMTILPFATEAQADNASGAVYAMTNDTENNEIAIYDRAGDGTLTFARYIPTDGAGGQFAIEDPIGSQGSLILIRNNKFLVAANAGSDDITVFRVKPHDLQMVGIYDSQGVFPTSLAFHEPFLYVLNAANGGNISGFTMNNGGHLTPLENSTRNLSADTMDPPPPFIQSPGQVSFSPDGENLVVSQKGGMNGPHQIIVFPVGAAGLPSENPVATNTRFPFGFVFDQKQHLIVAEPFGESSVGTPDAGAVSSYTLSSDGSLSDVNNGPVVNGQSATCWIVITAGGHYAYTTNNGSGTITGYGVDMDGRLSLLNSVAAYTGADPVDLAVSSDGSFLYNVNAGDGTISMFRINNIDGSLTSLGNDVDGLIHGSAGIAVR